jgi:hypothetical protein
VNPNNLLANLASLTAILTAFFGIAKLRSRRELARKLTVRPSKEIFLPQFSRAVPWANNLLAGVGVISHSPERDQVVLYRAHPVFPKVFGAALSFNQRWREVITGTGFMGPTYRFTGHPRGSLP